jgi:23S rRNA pseudouridine1911/1915/1917 synthase
LKKRIEKGIIFLNNFVLGQGMEILYKSKNCIVINKPAGVPVEPDLSSDPDAMTLTSLALKENGESDGLWLVHRLDRVVGGLVVFARNKKSAAELSRLFSEHKLIKEYYAVVEGELIGEGEMRDYIYKDAKSAKAFIVDRKRNGVKEAVLNYKHLESTKTEKGTRSLLSVSLLTGRYHQIRAQLASRAHPLVGDGKYGSTDKGAKMPALFAFHLSFSLFSQRVDIKIKPDTSAYPFSLWRNFL